VAPAPIAAPLRGELLKNAVVRHDRHYTIEEARAELPWVSEQLTAMREAHERLTNSEARKALTDAAEHNGGGRYGKQVGEAFVELRARLASLSDREIVLRDLERGLIDFPAVRDDREVYLCWIEGEPDIEFWHDLDAGYAGRRPL
jgi:hypothetical protein